MRAAASKCMLAQKRAIRGAGEKQSLLAVMAGVALDKLSNMLQCQDSRAPKNRTQMADLRK